MLASIVMGILVFIPNSAGCRESGLAMPISPCGLSSDRATKYPSGSVPVRCNKRALFRPKVLWYVFQDFESMLCLRFCEREEVVLRLHVKEEEEDADFALWLDGAIRGGACDRCVVLH
jgi:hypothetical protein